MKKSSSICVIIILCVFPCLVKSSVLLEDKEFAGKIQILESWIKAQMEYRSLPGMAAGIVYDQELIYSKGFGYSNLETKKPVSPETIFRIASITKAFTAAAIMQLRDEGRLQLDDPVEKYLKWFKIKHRFPEAPPITIRHLLTHTSGLPRESSFPYWTDHKFPTREQMIKALPEQETIYAAESKYKYSNLALALAGEIVSEVSGITYEEYITKNILEPLEMNSTIVSIQEDEEDLAVPYSQRLPDGSRKIQPFTNSRGITPAANMSSNVVDLAQYISLQFRSGKREGSQILNGSSLREMHRVHWLNPSWKSGRGIGFGVWKQDNYTAVGHGGWVAGNRTQIIFIPEETFGVIVLTNSDDGEPGFFARKILKMILPALKKIISPAPKLRKADPAWKKYTGLYEDSGYYRTEVLVIGESLFLNGYSVPPEDDPESSIKELYPEGPDTFRLSGKNGNGEIVRFEMDKNGKVKRLWIGANYTLPISER